MTIVINLHENSAIAVDLESLSTKSDLNDNIENVIKLNQNFSKSLLKEKSRHSLSHKLKVQLLKHSNFEKKSIEKSTNNLEEKKQFLNLQIFQSDFNIFTTINRFSENQQKFRTQKFTK